MLIVVISVSKYGKIADGPSMGKLLPSDEILDVNGEDVREATKDHVVHLVRSSGDKIRLTVCQPIAKDVIHTTFETNLLIWNKLWKTVSDRSKKCNSECRKTGTPKT